MPDANFFNFKTEGQMPTRIISLSISPVHYSVYRYFLVACHIKFVYTWIYVIIHLKVFIIIIS